MPGFSPARPFKALSCGRLRYNAAIMIPQDLLDILVCPVCKKPLVLKDEGTSLKCGECRRVYPIRDNIPILLVDEAVTDPA
jgi:uncharacterized protein YbaR (Trm112 family)